MRLRPMSTGAWLTSMLGQKLFQEINKTASLAASQQLAPPQVFHVALMLTEPLWDSNVFSEHHGEVNPTDLSQQGTKYICCPSIAYVSSANEGSVPDLRPSPCHRFPAYLGSVFRTHSSNSSVKRHQTCTQTATSLPLLRCTRLWLHLCGSTSPSLKPSLASK